MSNWLFPTTLIACGSMVMCLGAIGLAHAHALIRSPALAAISQAIAQGLPIAFLAAALALPVGWFVGQDLASGASPALHNPLLARDFALALSQGGVARASVPWLAMWLSGVAAAGFAIGLLMQRRDLAPPDPERQVLLRTAIAGGAALLGLLIGFCFIGGAGMPTNPVGVSLLGGINGGGATLALGAYHQERAFGFGDQAGLIVFLGLLGGMVGGYAGGAIIDTSVGIVTFVFRMGEDALRGTGYNRRFFSPLLRVSASLWFLTPLAFFSSVAVGFFLWTIVASWNMSTFWHVILTILSILAWGIGCAILFVILAAVGAFYGFMNVVTKVIQQARTEEASAQAFDWKSCLGATLAGVLLGYGAAIPWLHFLFVDGRIGIVGVVLGLSLGVFLGVLPYLKRWMQQWSPLIWNVFGSGVIALGALTVVLGLFVR